MPTCRICGVAQKRSNFPMSQMRKDAAERSCRPCSQMREDTRAHQKDVDGVSEVVLGMQRPSNSAQRKVILNGLVHTAQFDPIRDPRSFHGRMPCVKQLELTEPRLTWRSQEGRRPDGTELNPDDPDDLTASEYTDTPEVLAVKVKLLKELLLCSQRTMAYTGAGLSVAAGIGMAARGSTCGSSKDLDAEPTLAHYVMAELNRQDLLHGWVQQNHDGLPQKAGYRQEDINEIHGAWFDPSNPVVITNGGYLRDDLYADFLQQQIKSDLVIVVGTTLAGHNADSCVKELSRRSMLDTRPKNQRGKRAKAKGGTNDRVLGSVIINPQKTMDDGRATLRIFAKADDVMRALAEEFDFGPRATGEEADLFPKALTKIKVPYDKNGVLSKRVNTYWDLSVGSKVHISSHNNLEDAKQSCDRNITCETVGTVRGLNPTNCSIDIAFPRGARSTQVKSLGLWWLKTAQRGGTKYLPIVNVDPEEVPDADLD